MDKEEMEKKNKLIKELEFKLDSILSEYEVFIKEYSGKIKIVSAENEQYSKIIEENEKEYEGAIRKLEEADSLVSDKERQLQSAQAMFNVGEADRLTFLGARRELLSSRLSRLEALVQAQQSLGLLEDALQRPLDPSGSFLAVPEKGPRLEEER